MRNGQKNELMGKYLIPSFFFKQPFYIKNILGKLRTIKQTVTLYVSAGYKIRFSL